MVRPIHHIRYEDVECAVWQNETKEGKKFLTVSLYRNFCDKEGVWHKYDLLRKQDLLKGAIVLQEAYKFMVSYKPDVEDILSRS